MVVAGEERRLILGLKAAPRCDVAPTTTSAMDGSISCEDAAHAHPESSGAS